MAVATTEAVSAVAANAALWTDFFYLVLVFLTILSTPYFSMMRGGRTVAETHCTKCTLYKVYLDVQWSEHRVKWANSLSSSFPSSTAAQYYGFTLIPTNLPSDFRPFGVDCNVTGLLWQL